MKLFPSSKTFLSIFGLTIQWYAVLILTGAFIAFCFIRRDFKSNKHYSLDFAEDLFIYTLWVGIMGARLWFCIFYDFKYYFSNPIEILKIYDGGLAIQGGLVAGFLFAYWYTKKRTGYSFAKAADAIVPNVLIAQCLGRWGNFVNQECHGGEVSAEYFDGILGFLKEGMCINGHYYEPLFFYESMGCLIGFLLIRYGVRRFKNKRGDLAWAYLIWYGLIRFFIEGRRTDSLYFGNFRMAQLTSIAFLVIGVLGYIGVIDKLLGKKKKPTIIFDLDGTLIDTERSIIESYRYLFEKYGKVEDFTPERQVEIIGPPLKALFPIYFPDQDVDFMVGEYRKKNDELLRIYNKPMAHAIEVLKTFKEEGYDVGIFSTKRKPTIIDCLDMFDMTQYIDDIFGIDEVTKTKPDPEGIIKIIEKNHWNADDVIMVGDSIGDIKAGINYDAYTVGYFFNPAKVEALKEAKANVYIDDLIQLLDIVKENRNFTYTNQ